MPFVKTNWVKTRNAWVFNTLGTETAGPTGAITGAVANTAVQAYVVLPSAVKITKVAIGYTAITALGNANYFNLVYNTAQSLGGTLAYTPSNVAPNDNSDTGGVLGAQQFTQGSTQYSLVGPVITTTSVSGAAVNPAGFYSPGSPGFPNPALTALAPNYVQQGGLGVPTNVAVDGQPLFYTNSATGDVQFNATNFPNGTTTGGYNIFVPTNYDAVYPSGLNYNLAQVYPNLSSLVGVITLRTTVAAANTLTGVSATIFYEPLPLSQAIESTNLQVIPGINF